MDRMSSDPYAQRLYDWERTSVEPFVTAVLSKEGCLELVAAAARRAKIRKPGVRFAKASSMPCRAVPASWSIVIADWGRHPVTVLHEVAHLAAFDAVRSGEPPHGPSFLGQAMDFYAAFMGIGRGHLARTAAAHGLPRPLWPPAA